MDGGLFIVIYSRAVSSVTSSLFFPIVPWILQLGVIAYVIAVAIHLTTVGSPVYQVRNYNESCTSCNVENVQVNSIFFYY